MKNPTITEINFVRVPFNKGLVGFCSFILDQNYYVGNVAVFTRRDGVGIRLLYPQKNGKDCFHPITKNTGEFITQMVQKKFEEFWQS